MAIVGVGAALVVRKVILAPGDGGVGGRAEVLQVEGAVVDMLRRGGALLIVVVAGAQLLCLDVCGGPLVLALLPSITQRGQGVLLLLALRHPAVPCGTPCCLADHRAADAVGTGVGDLASGTTRCTRVTIGRQVLVKLVDIEGLDVGDDVTTQLADVHVPEVDVELAARALLQGAALTLQVGLARSQVCFGGGRWCRWALGLACWSKKKELISLHTIMILLTQVTQPGS